MSNQDPVILEYVEDASNVNHFILKPIAASEAFRRYNFLRGQAILNKSGNLRGMVINKNARTIYQFSSKTADRLAVLGVLMEISKEWSKMEKVADSNVSTEEKFGRITMMASASVLRSITSVVPTAVELTALSAKGYGDLYSLVTGSPSGREFGETAQNWAKNVRNIHSRQWDGTNWYNFVEATLEDFTK